MLLDPELEMEDAACTVAVDDVGKFVVGVDKGDRTYVGKEVVDVDKGDGTYVGKVVVDFDMYVGKDVIDDKGVGTYVDDVDSDSGKDVDDVDSDFDDSDMNLKTIVHPQPKLRRIRENRIECF